MFRPIESATICLSLVEVIVQAGHKVWMEVADNILLIVGNPRGILYQQLRPQDFLLLNIIIIVLMNYNKLYSKSNYDLD
jgi:hypothetical protein